MKRIIVGCALLVTSLVAGAQQYSMDLGKVGDGFGPHYRYIRISTTGWHVFNSNGALGAGGYCTYASPDYQNASDAVMAIVGGSPDSMSWDVDNSQGSPTCKNAISTGAGSDNLPYVDPAITEQEILPTSARVYVGPNNPSPIVVSNIVIENVPYTKFTISQTPGIVYNQYTVGTFECVIAKTKVKDGHLGFLGFKQEKKGVIYHIQGSDREGDVPLGIPRCDYAYIEIASYRLLSP